MVTYYHRAVEIGIYSVYAYQTTQKVTYHYQYNSNSGRWSCTIYSGDGEC